MKPEELVQIGMYINIPSLPLALAAAYKVFIDKFIPPGIEHSEEVCSRIRGGLAGKLADCCRPFLEPANQQNVGDVKLFGPDGNALEQSALTRFSAVDSEKFKEAFQDFLHDDHREFNRYWIAFSNKRRLQFIWSCVRLSVAAWAFLSLVGIVVFGAWAKCELPVPSFPWIVLAGILTSWPIFLFVACLIPYAFCSNKLATVED